MSKVIYKLNNNSGKPSETICTGDDGNGNEVEIRVRESGETSIIDVALEIVKNEGLRKNKQTPLVIEYDTVTEKNIPVIYCYPEGAEKLPVIFFNHGTGSSSVGELHTGIQFANENFFVVLMDSRLQGRRKAADFRERFLEKNYKETYLNMLLGTCEDISRLIDHLEDDPRVDGGRIGISGVSQGGFVSFMAITLDKRIKAAAPMIGSPDLEDKFGNSPDFDSLDESLKEDVIRHSPLRNFQKMYPVALLIQNGVKDTIVPITGTRRLDEKLKPLYENMPEKYQYIEYEDKEHETPVIYRERVIKWFKKFL